MKKYIYDSDYVINTFCLLFFVPVLYPISKAYQVQPKALLLNSVRKVTMELLQTSFYNVRIFGGG